VFCFSLKDNNYKSFLQNFTYIIKDNKAYAIYNQSFFNDVLKDKNFILQYIDNNFNLDKYIKQNIVTIPYFKVAIVLDKDLLSEYSKYFEYLAHKNKFTYIESLQNGIEFYKDGCKFEKETTFFKHSFKYFKQSIKDLENNPIAYFFMANIKHFIDLNLNTALKYYKLSYLYASIDNKYQNIAAYSYIMLAYLEALLYKQYNKSLEYLNKSTHYKNLLFTKYLNAKISAILNKKNDTKNYLEDLIQLDFKYLITASFDKDFDNFKSILCDIAESKIKNLSSDIYNNLISFINEFKKYNIAQEDFNKLKPFLLKIIMKLNSNYNTHLISLDNFESEITKVPPFFSYYYMIKLQNYINEAKNFFNNLNLHKRDIIVNRILKIINKINSNNYNQEIDEFKKEFYKTLNPGTFEDALKLEEKLMNFFVEIKKIDNIKAHANDVAISQEGEYLIFSTLQNKIILLGINKDITQKVFEGNKDVINDISINVEENVVVACSDDHTLRVWDIESQKEIANKNFGQDIVKGISINRFTKEILALTANSKELLFLDLKTLKLKRSIPINRFFTKAVAISSNAKYITYANFDNSIIIYDIHHKKEVGKLVGHKSYVTALSIDYSGDYLVSSSSGGEVILWSLLSQKAIKNFNYQSKEIDAVAISNGGEYVTTIVDDIIYVYALNFNKWQDLQIEKFNKEQKQEEKKQKQEEKKKKEQKKEAKKKKKNFINIDFKKYRSKFFKALIKYIYDNFKNVKKD